MIAREVRLFLIALQFLTRVRIKRIDPFPDDWLPRAAKYMPVVGALIGAVVGAVLLVSAALCPAPLPIVIALVVSLLLTGALHEDGLADTADAFGGGATRERCLEIMKDSRIGTYGTLALIMTLALKGTALAQIDPISAARVLIAGYAGARLAAVLALAILPYAGGEIAKVSRTPSRMTVGEIVIAAVSATIVGFCSLDAMVFVVATLVALAAAAAVTWMARRKIGGYTGDVLGAVEQVYETTFLIVAAAIVTGPG